SEVSGGVRDVFDEKLQVRSPQLERGLRIKTNAMRGAFVENVFARDIEIGEAGSAIEIAMLYEEGAKGPFPPIVRNVRVERMTVQKARQALDIRGLPNSPARGIFVADSVFRAVSRASRLLNLEELVLRNVTLEPAGATERR